MSSLAVFMLLGGGAYAATKLPNNSVGANQIRASAVRSAEVKNKSLLAKDFKSSQLPSGARGAAGAAGAAGRPGLPGAPGSAVAYAAIKSNGDPQSGAGRSKNLVDSEHPSAGIYCLRFATPPRNVVATIDYSFGEGTASVNINQANLDGDCGLALPTANVSVATRDLAGGALALGFNIAVIN